METRISAKIYFIKLCIKICELDIIAKTLYISDLFSYSGKYNNDESRHIRNKRSWVSNVKLENVILKVI